MISIVYHKIKEYDKKFKHDKFLHVKNFEKQIHFFKKKYNFIDCKELFDKKRKFNNNDIFLTFDDGLKIHYQFVYPLLEKNKINGIFYLSTLPYSDEKILSVHKNHIILSKIKNDIIMKYLDKNLSKEFIDISNLNKFERLIYKNQKNLDRNVEIKKILNYSIKKEYRTKFIDRMFKEFFPTVSEKRFVKKYYMSEKELKNLVKAGMILGSHTVSHQVLSNLKFDEAKKEINESLQYLDQFTKYKTFCYPYGSKMSYNKSIKDYLEKKRVSFSVTVTNKKIGNYDLKNNRQEISRFDCNNFKYGNIFK